MVNKFPIVVTEAAPDNPKDITPDWLNFSPHGIDADYNNLFVAGGSNGLHIFDRSTPFDPQWLSKLEVGSWPIDVCVEGGYAYVSDGFGGMNIVDIDPIEATHVVAIAGPPTNTYMTTVEGGYAYVAAGSGGLYIVDVDPPEAAYNVGILDTPGIANVVDVEDGYAYVADYFISGFHIIDVSDPANPINRLTLPPRQ